MLYGIDVSSNQPERIVRDVANEFAIVKLTGNPRGYSWDYVNPYAKRQAADAMAKHGRLGLYHFANGIQAEAEADFFVDRAEELGYVGRAVLVLDYEAEATAKGPAWVRAFCGRVRERAGYAPVVYASGSVIVDQNLGSCGYPLWCANYSRGYGPVRGHTTAGCSIYEGCESSVLWQYTSSGYLDGYGGPLDCDVFYGTDADWRALAGGPARPGDEEDEMDAMSCAEVAARIHADMCDDDRNGYSWSPRNGGDYGGSKTLVIDGRKYTYPLGSYDCSSSVIKAWQLAIQYTKYAGKLDGATYTGNMRSVFAASGLFDVWDTSATSAVRGDVYLNDASHTAMCQDGGHDGAYGYDALSEFCINENGEVYGGKVGDQTGREAYVHAFYDYPWNVTLHYNGKADGKAAKPKAPAAPKGSTASAKPAAPSAAKLAVDGDWGPLTWKALQGQLGVRQSGEQDAATVKALQRKLKVASDGIMGPITRKALQKKLGVAMDGTVGPVTVRALQRALNAGEVAGW